jgi:leukotriene-A4 hydrolase
MPPSFPYGGMENPCLTFVTPTLLSGDKSLADVIAHEIAHSWTGNLVTNSTWEHFWLNEGWTVWLERKIMAKVKGEEFLKLSAQVGWKHLRYCDDKFNEKCFSDMNNVSSCDDRDHHYYCHDCRDDLSLMGADSGFTSLVWPLGGEDPDDAFSSVPYEKVNILHILLY